MRRVRASRREASNRIASRLEASDREASDREASDRECDKTLGWIENIYSLVSKNQTEKAVDVLFDNFDDLLRRSELDLCDSALRSIDIRRLDVTTMLGILSITKPARSRLRARAETVLKIEEMLNSLDPDRTDRLLVGLR